MNFKDYLYIVSQLLLPLIILVGKRLGDAPLTLEDILALVSIQIFQASYIIVQLLRKR